MINRAFWIRSVLLPLLICVGALYVYHTYIAPTKVVYRTFAEDTPRMTSQTTSAKRSLGDAPVDFIEAASSTRKAVVYIQSERPNSPDKWNSDGPSTGSGVLIHPEGYIATNYHVVEEGTQYSVTLDDNRTYEADLIGFDADTDLAVLKIEAQGLPHLTFGDSDALEVGEWVLAVGNPFRLQSSVTAGIVSAKGRDIDVLNLDYGIESFIQTDAAINAGNSGGALVTADGQLIGISTAILTFSGKFEGYSFAIPSKLVQKVTRDLIEYGIVHRGLLGISGVSVSSDDAERLRLERAAGVRITAIYQSGAAKDAGLEREDVIISIDSLPIKHLSILSEVVGRYRPGDTLDLAYIRDGTLRETPVILRNQMNTTDLIEVRKDPILQDLGFEVRDLLQSELSAAPNGGIKVISISKGTPIERTKMEPGYIITSVDDEPISSADDFVKYLESKSGRIVFEGYYQRYGGPWWYTFKIP